MKPETPHLKTTTITIAGIDLELFEAGDGAPLLFLHGGQGFNPDQPFVAPLAGRRRLDVPSHPGFGKSGLPDWLDSVDDIAHLYLELLDRLDIVAVDVVGCSIGGWIAAEMATKVPERIRRLIMVGPVGVKVGGPDRLDIPDIFAIPQDEADKLFFFEGASDQHKAKGDAPSPNYASEFLTASDGLALTKAFTRLKDAKLRHRMVELVKQTAGDQRS